MSTAFRKRFLLESEASCLHCPGESLALLIFRRTLGILDDNVDIAFLQFEQNHRIVRELVISMGPVYNIEPADLAVIAAV